MHRMAANDLTFFTSQPDAILLDRFRSTLAHVQYFDVLRTSGFHLLHGVLEGVDTKYRPTSRTP